MVIVVGSAGRVFAVEERAEGMVETWIFLHAQVLWHDGVSLHEPLRWFNLPPDTFLSPWRILVRFTDVQTQLGAPKIWRKTARKTTLLV